MEELKRHLKRKLLGDLRPILEAQVMSKEECRSILASIARGG
jgi:hypothetical protein